MAKVKLKPIQNLFLDNNVLQRMLKNGFDSSISTLTKDLAKFSLRTAQTGKTNLYFTPSNIFEFCGLGADGFLSAEELRRACKIFDPGTSGAYFKQLYEAIEKQVRQIEVLKAPNILNKLNDKLSRLPEDSRNLVTSRFISPLKKDPLLINTIYNDVTFHLFCTVSVPAKYSINHHIYSANLSIRNLKNGQTASIGKLISKIWQSMCRTKTGKESYPHEVRKLMAKFVGMHEMGDFLDSDLIHLAVTGTFKSIPEPVYCITEDNPQIIKQRVLLYKCIFHTLLDGLKKTYTGTSNNDFKGIDLKPGRVVCCNPDLTISEHFDVQRLTSARL